MRPSLCIPPGFQSALDVLCSPVGEDNHRVHVTKGLTGGQHGSSSVLRQQTSCQPAPLAGLAEGRGARSRIISVPLGSGSSRPAPSRMAATSSMWPFQFKLSNSKQKEKFSWLGSLATFRVLSSHPWPVVGSAERRHSHLVAKHPAVCRALYGCSSAVSAKSDPAERTIHQGVSRQVDRLYVSSSLSTLNKILVLAPVGDVKASKDTKTPLSSWGWGRGTPSQIPRTQGTWEWCLTRDAKTGRRE